MKVLSLSTLKLALAFGVKKTLLYEKRMENASTFFSSTHKMALDSW